MTVIPGHKKKERSSAHRVVNKSRVLRALPIGAVGSLLHRRAARSEIGHGVRRVQHCLQLRGVREFVTARVCARGDAVTDTADFQRSGGAALRADHRHLVRFDIISKRARLLAVRVAVDAQSAS